MLKTKQIGQISHSIELFNTGGTRNTASYPMHSKSDGTRFMCSQIDPSYTDPS